MPATSTRETIIVVHGTFAGNPSGSDPAWYAPGGSFCVALDADLASRQSAARCWAHLQRGEEHFHWDGANDWLSRIRTAARLREQIRRLHGDGWRVHLVAHSHGGNIVLNAITDHQKRVEPWFVARVALMGTPIYRGTGAEGRRSVRAKWWAAFSIAVWAILLYVSARRLDFAAAFQVGGPAEPWAVAAALLLLVMTAVFVVRTFQRFQRWFDVPSSTKGTTRWSPPFLVINSEYDEAYRALTGLPNTPNPLLRDASSAPQPAPTETAASEPTVLTPSTRRVGRPRFMSKLHAVTEAVRTRTATRISSTLGTPRVAQSLLGGSSLVVMMLLWQASCERIVSAPLPAAWAPVSYLGVLVVAITVACFWTGALLFPAIAILETLSALGRALASLLLLTFDRLIRRFAWDTIKSLSLGLSGAAESVDDIAVDRELSGHHSVYLELPTDIVADVQAQQATQGKEIHRLVYRPGLVWSPLSLVKELASVDFPLIHCCYYSNAECIQRIADWICEPLVQKFDGHITRPTLQAVGSSHGGFQNVLGGEIESPNEYVHHVNDLREKYGPLRTRWGTGTRLIGLRALERMVSHGSTPPRPEISV